MKIKSRKLLIILLFITGYLLFIISDIQAGYEIEIFLPGMPTGETEVTLTEYIRYIYLFGLGLIGVAALGVLVYGGFTYMLSDTITSKDDAKKYIWGAISGLVLGLSAYLILNTINPDLVSLKGLTLPEIGTPEIPTPPTLTCTPVNCDAGCEIVANCLDPFTWVPSVCDCGLGGSGSVLP